MQTTLRKIFQQSPPEELLEKLLTRLNKQNVDDEPLHLLTILDSNGLDDTLWCLRVVDGFDKEKRLFAVWCARQVQYRIDSPECITAINISEMFTNSEVGTSELIAARVNAMRYVLRIPDIEYTPYHAWSYYDAAIVTTWDNAALAAWCASRASTRSMPHLRAEQEKEFLRILMINS